MLFDGYWKAFEPPKPRKRFTLFGGMKIYNSMEGKTIWTNEETFVKRISGRQDLTQEKLLERFNVK
jgi:hypothetical protein